MSSPDPRATIEIWSVTQKTDVRVAFAGVYVKPILTSQGDISQYELEWLKALLRALARADILKDQTCEANCLYPLGPTGCADCHDDNKFTNRHVCLALGSGCYLSYHRPFCREMKFEDDLGKDEDCKTCKLTKPNEVIPALADLVQLCGELGVEITEMKVE